MKLKASTIIEVLIAMLIMMVSFVAATMLFGQIFKNDSIRLKHNAINIIEHDLLKNKKSEFYLEDYEFNEKGMTFNKTVEPYKGSQKLFEVSYRVFDRSSKELMLRKILVRKQ